MKTVFSLKETADYVREKWPEETAHILRVADEVCRNYFLFDLPWDMERTCEPVCFEGEIDWEYMPGDDPEFIYQMNRHRYFICLGQAYALTGEERYAEGFVRLLTDWAERVKLNEESRKTTWRSIEAGLRGEYWTKAFGYFTESPAVTPAVKQLYLECLRTHGDYLMESFGNFQISSNWGVLESHGLYLIGCELDCEEYCRAALERLKLEAGIQVPPDGVHWEQSAMYHNEVLICYMEALAAQYINGGDPDGFLLDTVEKMALADLAWRKPDGRQPLYGDSDDTDLREVLTRAAFLLSWGGRTETAKRLKFAGYPCMDYEGAWDLGPEAVLEYAALPAALPAELNYSLDDSGNYIVRSGWGEKADYLFFRNGFLGGGHGHTDKLHFDFCWDGEDVLVDAGRYRYVYDADRVWFKSAPAHNTVLADGADYAECTSSWDTENSLPEVRTPIREQGGFVLLEGGHTGYLQKGRNVYLNRKILILEEGLYLVLDTASTGESHDYCRLFHFSEGARLEREPNQERNQGDSRNQERNQGYHQEDGRNQERNQGYHQGDNHNQEQNQGLNREPNQFHYLGENTSGRIWLDGRSRCALEESKISRHYNEYCSNLCIRAENRAEGQAVMAAVFSKGEESLTVEERPVRSRVAGISLEEDCARAWHIRKGSRSYDVILRLRDVAGTVILLESGSCLGIGRLLAAGGGRETVSFF